MAKHVTAEFEQAESGQRNGRPQLAAALATAKLDQLARNARFLLHVVEGAGEAGALTDRGVPTPAGKGNGGPSRSGECWQAAWGSKRRGS